MELLFAVVVELAGFREWSCAVGEVWSLWRSIVSTNGQFEYHYTAATYHTSSDNLGPSHGEGRRLCLFETCKCRSTSGNVAEGACEDKGRVEVHSAVLGIVIRATETDGGQKSCSVLWGDWEGCRGRWALGWNGHGLSKTGSEVTSRWYWLSRRAVAFEGKKRAMMFSNGPYGESVWTGPGYKMFPLVVARSSVLLMVF